MRNLLARAAIAWLLFCTAALGQSIEGGGGAVVTPPVFVPPSASYTGPGDIVSGAKAWWGLRGYNAAYASGSNAAVNLRRSSDNHTCDILVTTSGNLGNTANCSNSGENGTALATWCNATSCFATKLYDQSGALACGGSVCDVSQATAGNQPTLTFSCLGSLPCLTFNGTTSAMTSAATSTVAQPLNLYVVTETTGNFASAAALIVEGGNSDQIRHTGASTVQTYAAGFGPSATASDSASHVLMATLNGASTVLYVDAVANNGSGGTGGIGGGSFLLGTDFGSFLTGFLTEAGWWGTPAFTGTQATNMCHNAFTYWGTSTSC